MSPERALLVSATAWIIAAAFFRVLEPWPLKFIYDFIFRHGHDHGRSFQFLGITLSAAGSQNRLLLVWLAVGGMVGFGGLAGAFDYLSNITMGVAASRVLAQLRARPSPPIHTLDMGR